MTQNHCTEYARLDRFYLKDSLKFAILQILMNNDHTQGYQAYIKYIYFVLNKHYLVLEDVNGSIGWL